MRAPFHRMLRLASDMLLVTRGQIAGLLTFGEYVDVVEAAFRAHAEGRSIQPGLMHVSTPEGEFHIKAGGLLEPEAAFGLKCNGGFFQNRARFGLPNIQGLILLANAETGRPLALLDSMEITIQRTGAATAVAARHLARPESAVATICGCGNQGRVQLRGLCHALPIRKAFAWSRTPARARGFAETMSHELGIDVEPADELRGAIAMSDVVVTCTPAKRALIGDGEVPEGTFLAAVGADSPDKQELDARLTARSAVYGDLREQCAEVGEFHHAIAQGLAKREDFRGELGDLLTNRAAGRRNPAEITLFDSTGTALQDVAAAMAVYRKAVAAGIGVEVNLAE
jgi:ornithine cyclodeaminase/alanine dehydrogenase